MVTQNYNDILSYIDKSDRLVDKRGNRGGERKKVLYDVVSSFDIETSTIYVKDDYYSFMYIWQWDFDAKMQIIGRTWQEFINLVDFLTANLEDIPRLVVYVHNLSYEFSYLESFLIFTEVFAVKPHRVLRAVSGILEFRDNYLRTNMSLEKWLNKLPVKHKKLVGQLDYSVVRYPWTPLSLNEISYALYDVIGMSEGIRIDLEKNNDTLLTIPYTSTGYLRREVKAAMRAHCVSLLKNTVPSYIIYKSLRRAFEGGDCHANRYFSGKLLDNVKSADRSSSYPAEQCNLDFPVGHWNIFYNTTVKGLKELSDSGYAFVVDLEIDNISLIDDYFPDPILSVSKCWQVKKAVEDNGRILRASKLYTTVTDIKFFDILDIYKFDCIKISNVYYCRYGKLPSEYTSIIRQSYIDKTRLKGVKGEEYYYNKQKEKTNSCYGLSAQDPARISYDFIDNDFVPCNVSEVEAYNKAIKAPYMSYAWGVWTTAHARHDLLEGIKIAYDKGYAVYWDTDSVKYLGDVNFNSYNKKWMDLSKSNGNYAVDPKGVEHYMGVYETDGIYNQFITLGAKKYAYTDSEGLHVTVSGVSKKYGAEELGDIRNFKEGFTFIKAGGTKAKYHTNCHIDLDVDGHNLTITDNMCITPTTYTLGLGGDYKKLLYLLNNTKIGRDFLCNILDNIC